MAHIVFWCALGIFLYIIAGHGLMLALLRLLFPRPIKRKPMIPSVCFIIPVYNEEKVIEAKLENTLGLDYPQDKLKIVVVSDGSTDGTDEKVKITAANDPRILLERQSPRQGRAAAINTARERHKSEVYAISDADVSLDPGALREIVQNFADLEVGAAVARFVKLDSSRNPTWQGIKSYWDYEQLIHIAEMEIVSIPFLGGNLSVVRGDLLPQVPRDVTHDHYLPSYLAGKGFRSVYDRNSVTYEYTAKSASQEILIRSRNFLMGTNFLRELPRILNLSEHPWFFFNLLVRRILRWFSPLFLIVCLAAAVILLPEPVPLMVLASAVLGGFLTVLMLLLDSSPHWLSTIGFFFLSQLGLLWGIIQFILGKRIAYWDPPR